MSGADLHPSIVALVSLAANIAANHPRQGLCQVERLRGYGIAESQIAAVMEIARHIRDEAAESLDASFDKACGQAVPMPQPASAQSCCTPTPGGRSCC